MSDLRALVGTRLLRLGDDGPAVKAVQLALASRGYKLRGTSYFGPATDTAVEDFQRHAGLSVDGIVGPDTVTALDWAEVQVPAAVIERPLWTIAGLKWLNTREITGAKSNPDILEWAKDQGLGKVYNNDDIPWCALFANEMLREVGLKGTGTLWALDFNSNTKWPNVKLDGPAVGAFVPMGRDGGGHITTVIGRDTRGRLMCLGGNQSNMVNIVPFPKDRPLAYRWPLGPTLPAVTGFDNLPVVAANGALGSLE